MKNRRDSSKDLLSTFIYTQILMNAKNSKPTSVLLPLYATILKDPIFVAVSKDTREMERIVQVGIFYN